MHTLVLLLLITCYRLHCPYVALPCGDRAHYYFVAVQESCQTGHAGGASILFAQLSHELIMHQGCKQMHVLLNLGHKLTQWSSGLGHRHHC